MSKLSAQIEELFQWTEEKESHDREVARTVSILADRMYGTEQVLEILIKLAGKETVLAELEKLRYEKAMSEKAAQIEALEKGVERGYTTRGGAVTGTSFICGIERSSDGTQANPNGDGWTRVFFQDLTPASKEFFKAATEGDKVELADGATFELQAVYTVDEQKFNTWKVEQLTKAAEAQAAALGTPEASNG